MYSQGMDSPSLNDSFVIDVQLRRRDREKTLWLDVRSPQALKRLGTLFEELSKARVSERSAARLTPPLFRLPEGLKDLVFTVVDKELSQTSLVEHHPAILTWARHNEGWLECAGKVKALMTFRRLEKLWQGGHQYLGRGGSDEIEVSYIEG